MKRSKHIKILMSCLSILLFISGCKSSPSAQTKNPGYVSIKNNSSNQLTYSDVFDDELEDEITEDDIQEAILQAEHGFTLPANTTIILAESGKLVPDIKMQNEMSKYYQVSVYSGLPKRKARTLKNRQEETTVQNNYMRTLRLIAAKGHQKAIIVYWSTLQLGSLDEVNREIIWADFTGGAVPANTFKMRYLLRFALVDVSTGNWSMFLPITQSADYRKANSFNTGISDMGQFESLKQRAYIEAARLISQKYQ